MFFLLLLLWIILNGGITPVICVTGGLVSAFLCLFCRRYTGYSLAAEKRVVRLVPQACAYALYLIWEILKSNLAVMRMVYRRREPEPVLVHFDSGLATDAAEALLANSISLTPGTITVWAERGEMCVHALDRSFAEGIETCGFAKRLRKMEEDADGTAS